MERRQLGRTGIQGSAIGLGTMGWSQQNNQVEACARLDLAIDRGVGFFDTAVMYPVLPRRETEGRTETCIGSFLARPARGSRPRWWKRSTRYRRAFPAPAPEPG